MNHKSDNDHLLESWANDTVHWLEEIVLGQWMEEYDRLLFGDYYDQIRIRDVIFLETAPVKTAIDQLRCCRLQRLEYHYDALTKCWIPKSDTLDRTG